MWTSEKKGTIMRNVVEKGDAGRDVAGGVNHTCRHHSTDSLGEIEGTAASARSSVASRQATWMVPSTGRQPRSSAGHKADAPCGVPSVPPRSTWLVSSLQACLLTTKHG